jgi:hypothetical protein
MAVVVKVCFSLITIAVPDYQPHHPWQEDTERRADPCNGISTIAAMATPEWRTTFTSF